MAVSVKSKPACLGIKLIIKTFWNIYLQDNYHFKNLNFWINGLIFRIWIKNVSKYNSRLKNPQKKESKLDQNSNTSSTPKRAIQHSWSADWPKFVARSEDSLTEIKPIFFNFLEIWRRSTSFLIIQLIFRGIPTSINRGNRSKVGVLLFWLFNSPYVKDVLEAFALGTSFL